MYPESISAAQEAERAGSWQRALDHYEAALRVLPREGTAREAARVLRWIGTVHRERGDLELAEEVYAASLAIADLNELTADRAAVWNCLAITAQYRGHGEEAERLYMRARDLAERAEDLRLLAMVDQNLGTLASIRGDATFALASYRSALRRYRVLQDDLSAAGALTNIGKVHVSLSEVEPAESSFEAAAEAAARVGNSLVTSYVEMNRAELYLRRQRFEDAREACDRALAGFSRTGSKAGLGGVYRLYGALYREVGRAHLAEVNFSQALSLASTTGDRLLQAETLTEWALLHTETGQTREALVVLNRAHRLFLELRASRHVLQVEGLMLKMQPRLLQTISAYGDEVTEASDPEIGGHARRVGAFATLLGDATGVSAEDRIVLRTGALLHDVGKAVIPNSVLTKHGSLSSAEWELVKSHTVVGHELVADLEFPWDITPVVRSHHEHWDGSGYPDGLRGDDIPVVARLVCVADVFDALTSTRSYRPAMSASEALAVMQTMSGTILDPDLCSTFVQLARDGEVARAATQLSGLAA